MINKKNMWFLTLFSLILVLSVYYITMPSELLIDTNNQAVTTSEVEEESENATLVALRVEREEDTLKQLQEQNDVLTSTTSSVDEKNSAYETMKGINVTKGEEEDLETAVKNDFNLDSVITIDGDKIKVVASNTDASTSLANKIMRTIQSKYTSKMYISVKFAE